MELSSSSSHDRQPAVQMHTAELIKFRDIKQVLVFTLQGGATLSGVVRWFDDSTVHLVLDNQNELTVFKHAILYYQAA